MSENTIVFVDPATIRLPYIDDKVRNFLKYLDKSVEFQISKLKREARYRNSNWAAERAIQLKQELYKYACWSDQDDNWYSYSGLANLLSTHFGWGIDRSGIEYPEPKLIPWAKKPEFTPYGHQTDGFDACIKNKHTAISVPTGGGKSRIILDILKHYGLKSVVAVPSVDIARSLYEEFKLRFGMKYVGMYGGGKKESKKLFTVAVAQSLVSLMKDPESDHYKNISSAQVFCFDESHLVPASTFEEVCLGVLRKAPYRFFLSATQMRNDGTGIILKGITGDVSYKITFKELVDKGILAKPLYKVFRVNKAGISSSTDPKTEMRNNLYSNANVNKIAADLANKSVTLNRPTIILIEEIKQFASLYANIKVPFVFCHGGTGAHEELSFLPKDMRTPDNKKAIEDFNSGKVMLMIGTSCITTGVDLKPTKTLINLQGGSSPIKFYQGMGRGTRVVPGKTDFWYIDFLIKDSKILERQTDKRMEFFNDLDVGTATVVN